MKEILDVIKKYKIVDSIMLYEDYVEIVVKDFVSIKELDNIRKLVEEIKEMLGVKATVSIYIHSIVIKF